MSRSLWLSRVGLALLTSTAAVGLLAAPAQAATTGSAYVSGTRVVFKAGSGKTNKVVVTRSGRTVTVDDAVALKPGKGCKKVDSSKVRCTTAKTPTRVLAYLGAKNDSLVNRSDLSISVSGGDGNDKILGGSRGDSLNGGNGNDQIWGSGGNDALSGGDGNDALSAGAGNDRLDGGFGNDREYGGDGNDYFAQPLDLGLFKGQVDADVLAGDAGTDRVDYSGRRKAVNADSDGVADDGGKGERDNVSSIEQYYGGAGNDRLVGTNGNDDLQGGAGNDTLIGLGGNDQLVDLAGNNRLDGGAGNDRLTAGTGSDVLFGGPDTDLVDYFGRTRGVTVDLDGATGDDGQSGERDSVGADVENVYGGEGADRITGNAAANTILGNGGNDVIRGGAGNDFLSGDDGADLVYGEAGDDYLNTGGGLDTGTDRMDGGDNATTTGDNCWAQDALDTTVNCEYAALYWPAGLG